MRLLVLYFNELSAPSNNMGQYPEPAWRNWASTLFSCLRQVAKHQPESFFTFPGGCWHSLYGEKPLSTLIREWLERDQYRWLLSKIRNDRSTDGRILDVYFDNQKAHGLTLSHIASSWAFSFPITNSPWLSRSITATELCLEDDKITECACEVKHLSKQSHASFWQQALLDWGKKTTEDNVIGNLGKCAIAMYPLDHGYPHIHLISLQVFTSDGRKKTVAKYRVDRFERMEGPPLWDNDMRSWIEKYRDQLLCSWERCQRGGHPYQIAEDDE